MRILRLLALFTFWASSAFAAPAPDDIYIRVVDVGAGLCVVTKIPGDRFFVYDTGDFRNKLCFEALDEIAERKAIDLLILSHNDADHIGNAEMILKEYRVKKIIWTGQPRTTATLKNTANAIAEEVRDGSSVINLQTSEIVPGTKLKLGPATLTLIAGWGAWEQTALSTAERNNAISVVAKLEYKGNSILFTGDTVGKRLNDPDTACKDAEKVMADNNSNVSLKANVIIAPHHGANNANATCLIEAVKPTFVIFSAGHKHHHPTEAAARRYLKAGIKKENMFRTDRGDDEGGNEWSEGRIAGCVDKAGDDDVEIILPSEGSVKVKYMRESDGC